MGVMGTPSHDMKMGFAWDEARLQFAVREPFPSVSTGTSLVFGEVSNALPLTLESLMPEHGVLFSDGIEKDYLEFKSGTVVEVRVAKTQGKLALNPGDIK